MAVAIAIALGACTRGEPARPEKITIPDLTGLGRQRAVGLIDNLDLTIRIERIDPSWIRTATPAPGAIRAGRLARDVVVMQQPPPDSKVDAGAIVTLFVPPPRELRVGERPFRLLTHCGLSLPLHFANRLWLPVDPRLRRTINPPRGFASDGYYDRGTIRRVDVDTVVYTSSVGVEVEYEPTGRPAGGCE